MPFDLLPHHNIKFPEFRAWFPPWEMYQGLINARQRAYDTMLKGLDSVLNAADPINIAKRRQAMADADYQQKYGNPLRIAQAQMQQQLLPTQLQLAQAQAAYQMELLPIQKKWLELHGYAMPTTPQGMRAARQSETDEGNAAAHRAAQKAAQQAASGGGHVTTQEEADKAWEQMVQPPAGSTFATQVLDPLRVSTVPSVLWGQGPDTGTTDVTAQPPSELPPTADQTSSVAPSSDEDQTSYSVPPAGSASGSDIYFNP